MSKKFIKEVEVKVKIPYVCLTIERYTNMIDGLLEYSILTGYEDGIILCLNNLMEIHMWDDKEII